MDQNVNANASDNSPSNGQSLDAATITANIVKAYLAGNHMDSDKLPELVRQVMQVVQEGMSSAPVATLEQAVLAQAAVVEKFPNISKTPVVPVEESVQHDYVICLIDGHRGQMIKRHLKARYGMTFEEYVEHFNLPKDYPSVAPGYSALKRGVAIQQGLGSTIDKTPRDLRTVAKRGRARQPLAA